MAQYNINTQAQTLLDNGWTEDQIIALAPNQDIQHKPGRTWTYKGQTHSKPAEWFAWNRTALDAIDRAVASATEKDEATQAEPVADPATDRQIAYIERLLINRRSNGEGDGFISIPENLHGLTKRDASTLIDSLTGAY